MTIPQDHQAVLSSIQRQRDKNPLAILTLAEPIQSSEGRAQQQRDDSDVSNSHDTTSTSQNVSSVGAGAGAETGSRPRDHRDSSDAHLTPTALAADLAHYQSLFSKLRFSYLEQVTKEKYLRSIVGEPPVLVSAEDNVALEEKLVGMKTELKAKKTAVEETVKELESLARRLAQRYEGVEEGVQLLRTLPAEVERLESEVDHVREMLREKQELMNLETGTGTGAEPGSQGENPSNGNGRSDEEGRMNIGMGLAETEHAVEERKAQAKKIQEQIEALQKDMPAKIQECERVERELEELEVKRNEVTRVAREMQRRKEEGGRDMLEEQGRWYKASEVVLNGLLGEA